MRVFGWLACLLVLDVSGFLQRTTSRIGSIRVLESQRRPVWATLNDVAELDEEWGFEEGFVDDDDDPFPILELDDDDMIIFPYTESPPSPTTNRSSSPLTLDQLSETFATNVSYFYLKNELGLSDNAMWRITYEASSALGMSTAVVRHKVDVLRETMNLNDHDVRIILERQPTILHLSADKNIAPTILFLLRTLDLGRDDLKRLVVACPAILCYRTTNLQAKLCFFTHTLQFTVSECRELLLKEPNLIRSSVASGLMPRFEFLRGDMELALDKLKLIVQKNPAILLYSLDGNLVPKLVYYMIMKLQMQTSHVSSILLAYPQILNCHLDRTMLPITLYFVQELHFSLTEFRSILVKFPRLMTQSLRKIKYAVGYFRFALGLPASSVQKILYRAPTILGLCIDGNVKNKVEYLRHALALNEAQLASVVTAMPSLLVLNVHTNLGPKLAYLNQVMVLSNATVDAVTVLRDMVVRLPTLLGYSLAARIQPRVEAIVQAGLDPSTCITIGIPMKQEAFDIWLQRRADKQAARWIDGNERGIDPPQLMPHTSTAASRIVHWSRQRQPPPDDTQ